MKHLLPLLLLLTSCGFFECYDEENEIIEKHYTPSHVSFGRGVSHSGNYVSTSSYHSETYTFIVKRPNGHYESEEVDRKKYFDFKVGDKIKIKRARLKQ